LTVTVRQLRAFLVVAETRNFTRAAMVLHVAQPVISGLIRELEEELGFRLFDRTSRRVDLTDAATEFLTDARRFLDDLEQMMHRARDVGRDVEASFRLAHHRCSRQSCSRKSSMLLLKHLPVSR
jgi:DNA-binding transcriptional LysR family regulator